MGAELPQDVFHVHPRRFAGDGKLCRYLLIAVAPCSQVENLDLAPCKRTVDVFSGLTRHWTRYDFFACLHLANRAGQFANGHCL